MEKKRRARINQSLNDLKRLLLETDSAKKEVRTLVIICAFHKNHKGNGANVSMKLYSLGSLNKIYLHFCVSRAPDQQN